MANAGRGLPLLSGPPPSDDSTHAEIACRKCNKEFNILFTRARKCNHCGYSYCHNCSDFQALMPRGGSDTGYDAMNVCAFCIEFLTITAAGRSHLKTLPLSKLKKYVNAYNIKISSAVEKDDIIDAIINVRSKGPNGCLPPANENFYRKYSVPNRTAGVRPRGIFSRLDGTSSTRPQPPPQPPRSAQAGYNFPRPDLAPDHPPHPQYTPPQGPPPQSWNQTPPQPPPRPQYQPPPQPPPHSYATYNPPPVPPRPQQQQYQPQYHHPSPPPPGHGYAPGYTPGYAQYGHNPHHNPFEAGPPPVPHDMRPPQPGPYQRPSAAHSSNNVPQTHQPTPPPRPRTASAAAPTPPPTLDQLLTMSPEAISALSISALKSTLFTNHVNAGMILEKGELVKKVLTLVEDEKRERERQQAAEEAERLEMEERQREMREMREREVREREMREREAAERAAAAASGSSPSETQGEDASGEAPAEGTPADGAGDAEGAPRTSSEAHPSQPGPPPPLPPKAPPPPLPPKAQAMASRLERTGLCVICQDEEANIAIVDCGHLAMCRACSELIMNSTRECPLCRTRIVTEARLLRIFKT